MSRPADRRGFLRGLVLASAAAGTGGGALVLTQPARAVVAPAEPHPDAALLAAEVEVARAGAACDAAKAAYGAAVKAARVDHGRPPAELVLTSEDMRLCGHGHGRTLWAWEAPFLHTVITSMDDGLYRRVNAWSGRSLRAALSVAVTRLGPAGRTPHLLRRWRGLLPVADAFDARIEAAHARHRTSALSLVRSEAEAARSAAIARFDELPARTVDGLAAHVRAYQPVPMDMLRPAHRTLLMSAAAVAGVTLDMRSGDERYREGGR